MNPEGPYRFKPKLDHNAFLQWKHLPTIEKLYYLLEHRDIRLLYTEYKYIISSTNQEILNYDTLQLFLNEFKGEDEIRSFFKTCDLDESGVISFTEYVICRGEYDNFGNPHDVNEYDLRANQVIGDYQGLLHSGETLPDVYKYDEDGIIIDE